MSSSVVNNTLLIIPCHSFLWIHNYLRTLQVTTYMAQRDMIHGHATNSEKCIENRSMTRLHI